MWPPSKMNAFKLMKEGVKPNENWRLFRLIKIKITSDCYEDCNSYNLTAETEEEDQLKNDQQLTKKRKRADFATFFEGEKEVDVNVNAKIKLSAFPQSPAKLSKMLALNSSLNKKIVDMVPQNFKIDQAYKPSPLQQSPGLLSSNSKIPLFKSSMATITKDNNID
ncbi:uncharacterized protein LOC136089496 [Hydra vulgaris]|uniref:Uncharacterized protein LOC136089496 n=1 Tax=Hydra vulgaris TaxID=6087 RepID=A0ABM4DB66_HYDVU